MKTAKEAVREILDQIPDSASLEDIQYHIYVRQKVQKSLQAASEGKILSQAEVEHKISLLLGEKVRMRGCY